MDKALFWLCLLNTALIIVHEIDAAYWKEWRLFRRLSEWPPFRALDEMEERRGLALFLIVHIPLLFLLLYGLTAVANGGGLWYSLVMGILLIIHYTAHWILARKDNAVFSTAVSRAILFGSLLVAIAQIGFTVKELL